MNELVTQDVSRFVAGTPLSDVPIAVRTAAKRSMLDGFGLAVAGSRTEPAQIVKREVVSYRCAATDASVLGTGLRLPARFAALLNGLSIHADDFDDTQLAVLPDRVYGLLTHPTAPVLPAVLALGEELESTGEQLLLAYLLGVEVATKVAEAIDPRHYDAGFHSTGTLGTIGAGAGAARMLGLDAAATSTTLAIAASQASGLRENFGTMTKPLHAGRAAENGVVAARLASQGFTAASDILEAKRGFFAAAGGGFRAEMIMGRLGDPWTFTSPGVSIKPYPCGSLTHPAMTALLGLILAHDINPDNVVLVSVGTNRHMPNALIHHDPGDHLEAKFSMEFCMAVLLVEREAGLKQFTDSVVRRADIRAMMQRVRFEVDPEAEAAGYSNMTSIVRIRLRDGSALEARSAFAKGSPEIPMTDEEMLGKFLDCVETGGMPRALGEQAAEYILEIEREPSLDRLMALLTARQDSPDISPRRAVGRRFG